MLVLRLKEFRKKHNMSQRDVAELMMITQAYYWLWENGKNFPNAKQIIKLCDIFKCSPNDLFGIHGDYSIVMDELDSK